MFTEMAKLMIFIKVPYPPEYKFELPYQRRYNTIAMFVDAYLLLQL